MSVSVLKWEMRICCSAFRFFDVAYGVDGYQVITFLLEQAYYRILSSHLIYNIKDLQFINGVQ